MEEAAQTLGGFILWGFVIIVAFGLLLWLIAVIVGSIILARRVGHKKPKAPTKEKKPGDHPVAGHPDPHHPTKGGGGHDSHGHGDPFWLALLKTTGALAVVGAFVWFIVVPWLASMGFGQTPGLSREARAAINANTGTMPSATFTSASAPTLYVPSPLEAPAQGDGWSDWVYAATGQKIVSCEANDDLDCTDTESDVTKIGYIYQCMDRKGVVHNWSVEACEKYVAVRVQSKSNIALNLAVWREPYSG